ncbi:MAG: vWA domain-containing protein [Bacteroidota bacterium]
MPEVHLSFSFRTVFLLAAFCAACGISFWMYRRTIPPIPKNIRRVLFVLRAAAFFLLILLLGDPLLSFVTKRTSSPQIVVLVDHSQSMTIADRQGKRKEMLRTLLHSTIWSEARRFADLRYVTFAEKARDAANFNVDSLSFDGEATDISGALRFVKLHAAENNLQAVVLLTDGAATTGDSPLYDADELAVPIFAVGIGDTAEQKDLFIKNARTNEVVYTGTRVPVTVTVHASGFKNERAEILLKDETGKIIDRRMQSLGTGSQEYSAPLSFVPEQEGMHKYSVEVPMLPGELTGQNNRFTFFVKALKSKLNIVLIAGSPSADAACVRRALEQDRTVSVAACIERPEGTYTEGEYSQAVLAAADCIVLVGFPTSRTKTSTMQTLTHVLCDLEKPLFFIDARIMDYARLHAFDAVLPFSYSDIQPGEFQVFASVSDLQQNNVVMKLPSAERMAPLWNALPPIYHPQVSFVPKPGSDVLAAMRLASSAANGPLIVSQHRGGQKSEAVLGYGIWRWRLLAEQDEDAAGLFDQFIRNSIAWLTTHDDDRRVRVQPVKRLFTTHDDADFEAQVYDDAYRIVDDAMVSVTASNGTDRYECALAPSGSGLYHGTFGHVPAGDYRYTAAVSAQNGQLGTDSGVFTVGSVPEEFYETKMNRSLLQQIAFRTDGKYYDAQNTASLAEDLRNLTSLKPHEQRKAVEFELRDSRPMLALLVLVFSLEWFLRKRYGML